MHGEPNLKQIQKEWHGSLRAYAIGFTGSLLLTLISFSLVVTKTLSGSSLLYTLTGLALLQAIIQLRYFLHVGDEEKPSWGTFVFYMMLILLSIIVLGTLWIMNDLNNRVMMGM